METQPLNFGEDIDLNPDKTINIAVSGDVQITKTERKIIDTEEFQRLRRIKQLGTASLVFPSAVHTRFEHSLGTLKMADIMVNKINHAARIRKNKYSLSNVPSVSKKDHQLIRLAALLHDICHIPFGHTLEHELCVVVPDHDSDPDRFKYFLGPDSTIGKIIINDIGSPEYDLICKILKAEEKEKPDGKDDILVSSLGNKAYICDIVKNTVCADLLDYLRRDSYYCNLNLNFGDRFLNFLYLVNDEKTGAQRLAIRVWKEKEKVHRRDLIDELINLLNCRFFLGSAVYYHHAKLITSAMIARAVKQALSKKIFSKKDLWKMGDEELLYRMSISKNELTKTLTKKIMTRTLYDDFFEFSRSSAEAIEEIELLDHLKGRYHSDAENREKEEDRISTMCCNGKEGDVLIYCPDPRMSLKEAKMRISWKENTIKLGDIEDKLYKEKIRNISESHKKLWYFKVFISPEISKKVDEGGYNSPLLREWCKQLIKAGDDKTRHLKSVVDMTTLDILSELGHVQKDLPKNIFDQVVLEMRDGKEISREKLKKEIKKITENDSGSDGNKNTQ